MAAYVRGLAGRQLTELASYVEIRDLVSSALAGGVREDCVDSAKRDPNARAHAGSLPLRPRQEVLLSRPRPACSPQLPQLVLAPGLIVTYTRVCRL